ncbi:MAG: LamG domain-containing protein [Candidatus Hydrothermarchaeales archaeon]
MNGATFAPGKVGQAFSFDGIDDHIIVANSPSLDFGASSYTIDFWMNSAFSSVNQVSLSKSIGPFNAGGIGWEIRFVEPLIEDGPSVGVEFARADGTPHPAFLPPGERLRRRFSTFMPNEWHHVAVTYDFPRRTGKLYLDGLLVDSGQFIVFEDFQVNPPVSTGVPSDAYSDIFDLFIGRGTGGFFDGLIDEVEIYNRALDASEIQAIFNAGSAGKCKGEPFATFAASVAITLGPLPNDDDFRMKASFTLGAGSGGIDPLTEDVRLQVGTFSTTIPAGSFNVDLKTGDFKFAGIIDGVSLRAIITPLGANTFEFNVSRGQGADLTGTVVPVAVELRIGDDIGSTILEDVNDTAR